MLLNLLGVLTPLSAATAVYLARRLTAEMPSFVKATTPTNPLKSLVFLSPILLFAGCGLPEVDEDFLHKLKTGRERKEVVAEYFVPMPEGTNTTAGPAIRETLMKEISEAPAGTWFTFSDADTQELIVSYQVPDGSPALREDQAEKNLHAVFERLDPEMSGGSQDVHLIATSATVRKFRKTDLPPRICVIGCPMVVDHEGGGTITPEEMPCDGTIAAEDSCYSRMALYPEGSMMVFLTPVGSYGKGPVFRSKVENHLRLLTNAKKCELVRVTSDPKLMFDFRNSQWSDNPSPTDDCNGRKATHPEHEIKKYDAAGNEIVDLGDGTEVKNQKPSGDKLKGPMNPLYILIDGSGSMAFDAKGKPRPGPFNAAKRDAIEKIRTLPFDRFAVIVYGGNKAYEPVYQRFPESLLGGTYWLEATPRNREKAIAFIERARAGGGTPTGPVLLEAMKLDGAFSILNYSDGVPTIGEGGAQACLDLTKRLKERGIVINSVGVGATSVDSKTFDAGGAQFQAAIGIRTGGDYFALKVTEEPVSE